MIHGEHGGGGAPGDADLGVAVLDVMVGGLRGNGQSRRHLSKGITTRHQTQHFDLTITQPRRPGSPPVRAVVLLAGGLQHGADGLAVQTTLIRL